MSVTPRRWTNPTELRPSNAGSCRGSAKLFAEKDPPETVMRVIRFLVAFACLALGAVVGALNRQFVTIDLGAAYIPTNLGVALIVALLACPAGYSVIALTQQP